MRGDLSECVHPFIPLPSEDVARPSFALEDVAAGYHLGNRDQLLPDTKPAGTFIVDFLP